MVNEVLASALAEAARAMARPKDLQSTLEAIVQSAKVSIPGFEHVGISITPRKGPPETAAASSELVGRLDELQYELHEGPCYDTLKGASVVSAPAIRHDQRWPRYVPEAVKSTGLRSQLAVRLYLDDKGTVGGLNLYSTVTEEIGDDARDIADLFATHAALALGHARDVDDMSQALESRTIIGQAIGLVMARYHVSDQAAFGFLSRASSHANAKIRDIAAEMVHEANRNAGAGSE